jgi:hypothetical protein
MVTVTGNLKIGLFRGDTGKNLIILEGFGFKK